MESDPNLHVVYLSRAELAGVVRALARRAETLQGRETRRYVLGAAARLDGVLAREHGDPVPVYGRRGWLIAIGVATSTRLAVQVAEQLQQGGD